MAHNLLKLSGSFGTDILPAGNWDSNIQGHQGPYQSMIKPIFAIAYVSATVTLTNVKDINGNPIENIFATGAGTGILAAEGQMIFTQDVYAFTNDQPVKVWYAS